MSGPSRLSDPPSDNGCAPLEEPAPFEELTPLEGPTPFEEPAPCEGPRFLVDRMLGPLVRYLRFMGYDTLAATELGPGGPQEDSELLRRALAEGRILLTRDRELAGRGGVLVSGDDVLEQVAALARSGLVEPVLRLDRCSRCNTLLRPASTSEIAAAPYAPSNPGDSEFFWCDPCGRLYWFGSHAEDLAARLRTVGTDTGSRLWKYQM